MAGLNDGWVGQLGGLDFKPWQRAANEVGFEALLFSFVRLPTGAVILSQCRTWKLPLVFQALDFYKCELRVGSFQSHPQVRLSHCEILTDRQKSVICLAIHSSPPRGLKAIATLSPNTNDKQSTNP